MMNIEKFAKRLQKIMDRHDLSASSLADKIEVGRSSISHILSGRNKPGLEFVMKICSAFPEVDMDWLLNGEGDFPNKKTEGLPPAQKPVPEKIETKPKKDFPTKKVRKIVFFYEDGGFEVFEG